MLWWIFWTCLLLWINKKNFDMATEPNEESYHIFCTNYLRHMINIKSMEQLNLYLISNNCRMPPRHSLNFEKRPIPSNSQEEWKKKEVAAQLFIHILQMAIIIDIKTSSIYHFIGMTSSRGKKPIAGIFRQKGDCSVNIPSGSPVFDDVAFYTFNARKT